MPNFNRAGCAATLLALMWAGGAHASGSALSASSEGGSASVGSVSTSFEKSSASSSKGKDVAAGEYRVINVSAAPDRPGHLRVHLQLQPQLQPQPQPQPQALASAGAAPVDAPGAEVVLVLPQAAAEQGQLAAGQRVSVQHRPYGLAFAQADSQRSFFLVLDDDWAHELRTSALTL